MTGSWHAAQAWARRRRAARLADRPGDASAPRPAAAPPPARVAALALAQACPECLGLLDGCMTCVRRRAAVFTRACVVTADAVLPPRPGRAWVAVTALTALPVAVGAGMTAGPAAALVAASAVVGVTAVADLLRPRQAVAAYRRRVLRALSGVAQDCGGPVAEAAAEYLIAAAPLVRHGVGHPADIVTGVEHLHALTGPAATVRVLRAAAAVPRPGQLAAAVADARRRYPGDGPAGPGGAR